MADSDNNGEAAAPARVPARDSRAALAVANFQQVLEENTLLKEQVDAQLAQLVSRQATIEELRRQVRDARGDRDVYARDAFTLMAVLTSAQSVLTDGLDTARQDLRALPPRGRHTPAYPPPPDKAPGGGQGGTPGTGGDPDDPERGVAVEAD